MENASCNEIHKCGYYCDPSIRLHAVESVTTSDWNKERVFNYFNNHFQVERLLSVKEVLEVSDEFIAAVSDAREVLKDEKALSGISAALYFYTCGYAIAVSDMRKDQDDRV